MQITLTSRSGIVLIGCGVAAALALAFYQYRKNSTVRAAHGHREAATRALAEYLAAHYPQQKALVVSNPFTLKKGQAAQIYAFEEAGLAGLRTGFGKAISSKVVFPELRGEFQKNPASVYVDPKTTTPLSFLVADDAFDKLVHENSECRLLVTLVGIPLRFRESALWKKEDAPKLALLLPDWRMIGDGPAIRFAFKSGKIAAAVLNKPGAPPDDNRAAADYKQDFDSRFLLVTSENIDEILQKFPRLF